MPCGVGVNNDYAGVGENGSFGCGSRRSILGPARLSDAAYKFAGANGTGGQVVSTNNVWQTIVPIFTAPAAGTFNPQRGVRDNIYGPDRAELESGHDQGFPSTEHTGFEFRAEAYNFINHPNLVTTLANPARST